MSCASSCRRWGGSCEGSRLCGVGRGVRGTTAAARPLRSLACHGNYVGREGADRPQAHQPLYSRQPIEAAPPEVPFPIENPGRGVLIVVPDIVVPTGNLNWLADRHFDDIEAPCLQHLTKCGIGVMHDVLVRIPDTL